jgi:hypothetical protein
LDDILDDILDDMLTYIAGIYVWSYRATYYIYYNAIGCFREIGVSKSGIRDHKVPFWIQNSLNMGLLKLIMAVLKVVVIVKYASNMYPICFILCLDPIWEAPSQPEGATAIPFVGGTLYANTSQPQTTSTTSYYLLYNVFIILI